MEPRDTFWEDIRGKYIAAFLFFAVAAVLVIVVEGVWFLAVKPHLPHAPVVVQKAPPCSRMVDTVEQLEKIGDCVPASAVK